MPSQIHRTELLQLVFQHTLVHQESPYNHSFMTVHDSRCCKETSIGALHIVRDFICVFKIVFPASPFVSEGPTAVEVMLAQLCVSTQLGQHDLKCYGHVVQSSGQLWPKVGPAILYCLVSLERKCPFCLGQCPVVFQLDQQCDLIPLARPCRLVQ